MGRAACLIYGTVCYLLFFGTFLYAIGFAGDMVVPKSVDGPIPVGQTSSTLQAALINILLLGLFGIQHSIMARRGFKKHWTRIVPLPVERSTYVLATCMALGLMFWQWRVMPTVVWHFDGPAALWGMRILFFAGFGLVLYSTILIDHFDLFGLRQVILCWRGRPYEAPRFVMPMLYKFVRHPLYLGFIIAFWSASTMTQGHLLFAVVTTAYMLVGIQLEERDLIADHGEDYRRYRNETSMLIPMPRRVAATSNQS